jgi:hypothetical protein
MISRCCLWCVYPPNFFVFFAVRAVSEESRRLIFKNLVLYFSISSDGFDRTQNILILGFYAHN